MKSLAKFKRLSQSKGHPVSWMAKSAMSDDLDSAQDVLGKMAAGNDLEGLARALATENGAKAALHEGARRASMIDRVIGDGASWANRGFVIGKSLNLSADPDWEKKIIRSLKKLLSKRVDAKGASVSSLMAGLAQNKRMNQASWDRLLDAAWLSAGPQLLISDDLGEETVSPFGLALAQEALRLPEKIRGEEGELMAQRNGAILNEEMPKVAQYWCVMERGWEPGRAIKKAKELRGLAQIAGMSPALLGQTAEEMGHEMAQTAISRTSFSQNDEAQRAEFLRAFAEAPGTGAVWGQGLKKGFGACVEKSRAKGSQEALEMKARLEELALGAGLGAGAKAHSRRRVPKKKNSL